MDQNTIMKALVLAGERAEKVMARRVRNVQVRDVEVDQVWAFIGKKQKRVRPEDDQNLGDCDTFVGIERNTKLVLNIASGTRGKATTDIFIEGLHDAIAPNFNFQITSNSFASYKHSIPDTFGNRIDFAMLIRVYKAGTGGEGRYSPAEVQSVEVVPVCGRPDPARISTSIIERSNLSLRTGQRRSTRLTNGFSKKWEDRWAAVSLWYAYYNVYHRRSLRATPSMEAGLTDNVWELAE